MNLLKSDWFQYCGDWYIEESGRLRFSMFADKERFFDAERTLYMFVCGEEEILYVGKTVNKARQRFIGYRTPGESQQTNRRVHEELIRLLKSGEQIRIFLSNFPDQLKWDNISISLSAGLEDALIDQIQPRLNRLGRDPKAVPELAILQIEGNQGDDQEEETDVSVDNSLQPENFHVSLRADHTYVGGYLNLRKLTSEQLGEHNEELLIDLYRGKKCVYIIRSKINRKANKNGSVRVIGNNRELANWFQNFDRETVLTGEVLSKNRIKLSAKE